MIYNFPQHSDIRFETDDSYPQVEHLLFTLDTVVNLFDRYLPKITKLPLYVLIKHNDDSPMCYRKYQQIYLDTEPYHWNQAAYQFSHELCHYVIPNDVCKNLRWLEESLCETASYFFLQKLTEYWNAADVSYRFTSGEPYANTFTDYVANDINKAVAFDICSSLEIQSLESNCYQRNKNKYIAEHLLPIFNKDTYTWNAIPYLCEITANLTISDSLNEWIKLSPPRCRLTLMKILQLFCP